MQTTFAPYGPGGHSHHESGIEGDFLLGEVGQAGEVVELAEEESAKELP